jgi:hypothetical protein
MVKDLTTGRFYQWNDSIWRDMDIIRTVDSVEQILNESYTIGERIIIPSTGANYVIQTDSVAGYQTDSIAVIPVDTNYAVLQPVNGEYDVRWFGAVDDNLSDNIVSINKADNYSNGETILFQGDTFFTTGANITNAIKFDGAKLRSIETIKLNRLLDPGLEQVFFITSSVFFLEDQPYVRPEWWGGFADSVTVLNSYLEEAQESLDSVDGGTVYLSSGYYLVDDDGIDITTPNFNLIGQKGKTILKKSTGTSSILIDGIVDDVNAITVKDIIFDINNVSGVFGINFRGFRYREFYVDGCEFVNGNGIIVSRTEGGAITNNLFYSPGNFANTGISVTAGCRNLGIKNNTFRYLENGIVISGTPDWLSSDVSIHENYIDMGWMTGSSEFTGSATYSATTLTDGAATFPSLTAGSTVRILDTLSTGTGVYSDNNQINDATGTFITDGVKPYDLIKAGSTYGLVLSVVSETDLFIEFWMDSVTRLPVLPPSGGSYAVYQLNYGEVVSNTATEITVTRFWNKNGGSITPTSNSLYEVLYSRGNYAIQVEQWGTNFSIKNNTILRGWSDQIAAQGDNFIIEGNRIEWGQDMGITVNGVNSIITDNYINHQGAGGIWISGYYNTISNNIIRDATWENNVNTIHLGGIMLSGADSCLVHGNLIQSNTELARHSITTATATTTNNFIDGNFLYDSIPIQLYDGDSTIIGVNWKDEVNVVNATNTVYLNNDNSIYNSDGVIGDLVRSVDVNGNSLLFEGLDNGADGAGGNIRWGSTSVGLVGSLWRENDGGFFQLNASTSSYPVAGTSTYIRSSVSSAVPNILLNKTATGGTNYLTFSDAGTIKGQFGIFESGVEFTGFSRDVSLNTGSGIRIYEGSEVSMLVAAADGEGHSEHVFLDDGTAAAQLDDTPTSLNLGGNFGSTVRAGMKLYVYDPLTNDNIAGLGMTSGQFNFLTMGPADHVFTVENVEVMRMTRVSNGSEMLVGTSTDQGAFNLQVEGDSYYNGGLTLAGATSGTTELVATAVAGTTTATLQAVTGTIALLGDLATTATESAEGIVELATVAELDAGTDVSRVPNVDNLAGSDFGTKDLQIEMFAANVAVSTGDGNFAVTIPASLDGYDLVNAVASVHDKGITGTTDVTIERWRAGAAVDMLSTAITIGDEWFAQDGSINTANDDVITGDRIYINPDVIHSGTAPNGLSVVLEFRKP